jgi:hypothetical protein
MAYGNYKGRCLGRLMHFLYKHTMRSDEWIFHFDKIELWDGHCTHGQNGPVTCYWQWLGNTDIPRFKFVGNYETLNECTERLMRETMQGYGFKVQTEDQAEEIENLQKELWGAKIKVNIYKGCIENNKLLRKLLEPFSKLRTYEEMPPGSDRAMNELEHELDGHIMAARSALSVSGFDA